MLREIRNGFQSHGRRDGTDPSLQLLKGVRKLPGTFMRLLLRPVVAILLVLFYDEAWLQLPQYTLIKLCLFPEFIVTTHEP